MIYGCRDLSVKLHGAPTLALTEVSVQVPPGAVTAVVGGDGAGKSTLLRCLVGEIVPTDGVVQRPSKAEVGYMSSSSGTWSELTVNENIDFVAGAYGVRGQALSMRRRQLLRGTGLDHAGSRLAGQLSGGMRRKLGFVLASLHRPRLLVLDEPSTGVDPVSRVELWRLIAEAAADGAAVVMSTTYLDEAERASSILVLDRGRAVLQGATDEVMASVPGRIVEVEIPSDRSRAWRRGRIFHQWLPAGATESGRGVRVTPDLEDAIIVEMLGAGR